MASIRKAAIITAPADALWDFANRMVERETIIDVDERARRLVWSAKSGLEHHNASFQVYEGGPEHCRFVWIADVLPHEASKALDAAMDEAVAGMRKTFGLPSRVA
jgi:hypothetical protein